MEQWRRGEWPAAQVSFEAALRAQPNLLLARFLLAWAELNSRPPRTAEARGELSFCIRQQEGNAWFYLLRGVANGHVGQALKVSSMTEDRSLGETRFLEAESDFDTAWKLCMADPRHAPELRYVLLMNRGGMRQGRGRPIDAVADFREAIAMNPEPYQGHNSLAQAMRSLGEYKEAVASFGLAIERQPRMAALYRGRALARLDQKDASRTELELALVNLEKSAALEPPGHRAPDHILRGLRLLGLDRPEDALAAADAALSDNPDALDARLIRVDAFLRREEYDRAIAEADAAITRGGRSPELYRLRGLAKVGRGEFAGAIDDYSQALALAPGSSGRIVNAAGRFSWPTRPSWPSATSSTRSESIGTTPRPTPDEARRVSDSAGSIRDWPTPIGRSNGRGHRPGSSISPPRPMPRPRRPNAGVASPPAPRSHTRPALRTCSGWRSSRRPPRLARPSGGRRSSSMARSGRCSATLGSSSGSRRRSPPRPGRSPGGHPRPPISPDETNSNASGCEGRDTTA